jgi:hypothetical protein
MTLYNWPLRHFAILSSIGRVVHFFRLKFKKIMVFCFADPTRKSKFNPTLRLTFFCAVCKCHDSIFRMIFRAYTCNAALVQWLPAAIATHQINTTFDADCRRGMLHLISNCIAHQPKLKYVSFCLRFALSLTANIYCPFDSGVE